MLGPFEIATLRVIPMEMRAYVGELRVIRCDRIHSPSAQATGRGIMLGLCMVFVAALVLRVANTLWPTSPMSQDKLVFAVVPVLSGVIAFGVGWASIYRIAGTRTPPTNLEELFRVVCYLPFAEKRELEVYNTEPFEPVIFPYVHPMTGPMWSRMWFRYSGILGLALIVAPLIFFTIRWHLGASVVLIYIFLFRGWTLIRPKYLRLSPGLLEILCGSPFSSCINVSRSIRLDSCRTTVNAVDGVVCIGNAARGEPPEAVLGLFGLGDPFPVVEAIVRAAMGRLGTSRAPEDSICG